MARVPEQAEPRDLEPPVAAREERAHEERDELAALRVVGRGGAECGVDGVRRAARAREPQRGRDAVRQAPEVGSSIGNDRGRDLGENRTSRCLA